MDEYKIVITPDAETDLNELDDYISFYLMAPDLHPLYPLQNSRA